MACPVPRAREIESFRDREIPCLDEARSGSRILRSSQFFTGMFNGMGIRRGSPIGFKDRHGADPVEPLQSKSGRMKNGQ
jgi:hypothetical protein